MATATVSNGLALNNGANGEVEDVYSAPAQTPQTGAATTQTAATSATPAAAATPNLSQAVQQSISQMGSSGSYGQYAQDIISNLQKEGATPTEISSVEQSPYFKGLESNNGTYSNIGGGNTAAFEQAGVNDLGKYLNTSGPAGGAAGSTTTNSSQPTAPANNQTTTGLPSSAAISSDAPLPIQDFGATPSITASTVDPNQSQAYMQQAEQENATALAPQFEQQQSQLQDSNAARGISSSGAASYLQGNLLGQQASALASADEPITSQGYSYSQQDLQGNQAAQNAAAQDNANYYASELGTNESNYNNYLATLEGQGYNTGNEELMSYLGSYAPSSAVTGAITGAENAGTTGYNTAYSGALEGQQQALSAAGDAFSAS